MQCSVLAPAT